MRILACAAAVLLGAGLLLLELALTRLFGFLYAPTRVFTILGLGALGTAAGGFLAHRIGWHPRRRPAILATSAAVGGALAAVASLAAATGVLSAFGLGALEVLAAYLGFAVFGVALTALASLDPPSAGWAGGALFAGSALGAIAFPPLGDALQPPSVALLSAALVALATVPAALSALVRRRRAAAVDDGLDGDGGAAGGLLGWGAIGVVALIPVAAFALQLPLGWLRADPERISGAKSLFNSVGVGAESEQLVLSRWDAHSRTDVTEHPRNSFYRWVYQDGSFAGRMYRVTSTGAPLEALAQDIAFLPFFLPGTKDKVLVIGAGGGQEVLTALATGASEVVVAEPAPGPIAAARALSDYNGGLFDRPNVRVVAEDGRAFLRESGEQFDLIFLTIGATGAAEPGGASAGAGLQTLEAYETYMDGLRRDGRLIVPLRDQEELLRAFNTAFQVGLRRGASPSDAIRRLLALNNQPAAQSQSQQGDVIALPLLTVRKSPYLESEIRELGTALGQTPYTPLFLPHFEQQSMQVYPALAAMAEVGPAVIEQSVPFDIRPANDARPFFYESIDGFPLAPLLFLLIMGGATAGVAWFCRRPSGEAVELVDDLDAEAAAFLEAAVPWRYVGFAVLAGAAWGFLGLPLLNRLPHLLGQPALNGPVIYGALFAGAALGAWVSALGKEGGLRPVIGWAGLAGGILAVGILELLPLVSGALGGQGLAVRVAVLSLVLAPIGFCVGVPLPGAVRLLAYARRGSWAALVVAVAALAGTAARFLAYAIGLSWTLSVPTVLGGLCLFGVFLMAGLRALSLTVEEAAVEAALPADHAPFQRPAQF